MPDSGKPAAYSVGTRTLLCISRKMASKYFNAGSWTDSRPTFVTIGEEGVHIHEYHEHEYDERPDDCDPSEERSESDSAVVSVAGEAGLLEDVEYEGVGS